MSEQPRHWIDNVADLVSGRMHNTLLALNQRNFLLTEALADMEIEMTQNEQLIENAVESLKADRAAITSAVDALKAKIASTPAAEDLSQELADLESAVGGIHQTAEALNTQPAPVVSDNHTDEGVADPTIDHDNNPPIPLAGESGPTDAGAPTEVPSPGTPIEDPATTPIPDNAQDEAGLPSEDTTTSEDGGLDEDPLDEGNGDPDTEDEDDFDTAPVEEAPVLQNPVDQVVDPAPPEPVTDPEFVASDPEANTDDSPMSVTSHDPIDN